MVAARRQRAGSVGLDQLSQCGVATHQRLFSRLVHRRMIAKIADIVNQGTVRVEVSRIASSSCCKTDSWDATAATSFFCGSAGRIMRRSRYDRIFAGSHQIHIVNLMCRRLFKLDPICPTRRHFLLRPRSDSMRGLNRGRGARRGAVQPVEEIPCRILIASTVATCSGSSYRWWSSLYLSRHA